MVDEGIDLEKSFPVEYDARCVVQHLRRHCYFSQDIKVYSFGNDAQMLRASYPVTAQGLIQPVFRSTYYENIAKPQRPNWDLCAGSKCLYDVTTLPLFPETS